MGEEKTIGEVLDPEKYKESRVWGVGNTTDPFHVAKRNDTEKEYWEKVESLEGKKPEKIDMLRRLFGCYRNVLGVPDKLSEEDFAKITKGDEVLYTLAQKMAIWFHEDDGTGGFLLSSPPGIGKTKLIQAFQLMSKIFGGKLNKGEFEYLDMNLMISNFVNQIKEDLTYYHRQNIIVDEVSERLNHVNNFSFKFSLDLFFENRYNLWKASGFKTIIATNISPIKVEGLVTLEDLLSERALDRIKEMYHIEILFGKSKRKSK